ncbi:hypothetical protein, partial [Bradyrhizobium sp. ORS 375]|uniref:hypothetical protein n=1 Tax=Bradyrhizobium sp. (strain ORS 375) TaxID=566679 RepID=UPI001AEC1B1F
VQDGTRHRGPTGKSTAGGRSHPARNARLETPAQPANPLRRKSFFVKTFKPITPVQSFPAKNSSFSFPEFGVS